MGGGGRHLDEGERESVLVRERGERQRQRQRERGKEREETERDRERERILCIGDYMFVRVCVKPCTHARTRAQMIARREGMKGPGLILYTIIIRHAHF